MAVNPRYFIACLVFFLHIWRSSVSPVFYVRSLWWVGVGQAKTGSKLCFRSAQTLAGATPRHPAPARPPG